jgi:hypothetical protein
MRRVLSSRLPRIGRCSLALLWLGAAVTAPRLASAGVITFSAPTIHLTESTQTQTGFLDVTVSETGGSDTLYQFQADLLLPAQSNITFIGADFSTTAPYVFAGNSWDIANGGSAYFAANEASNSDEANTTVGTALSSTPLGLLRIEYSVAPNFVGSEALTFNQSDPNNNPFADYVNTISVTSTIPSSPGAVVNGQIIVATPEPATGLLVLLGVAGWLGCGLFRDRRRGPCIGPSSRSAPAHS